MNYKINDVSRILHVSREQLRYYETLGLVKPSREKDNNYRTYSLQDIFVLIEVLAYKGLHLSLKDIPEALSSEQFLREKLTENAEALEQNIRYETLLAQRTREVMERLETTPLNLGHIWVRYLPARCAFKLISSSRGEFDEFLLSDEERDILFEANVLTFLEPYVELGGDKANWYLSVQEPYREIAGLKNLVPDKTWESQTYLCTAVMLDNNNEYDPQILENVFTWIRDNGYRENGGVFEMTHCRKSTETGTRTCMEIQIPIVAQP